MPPKKCGRCEKTVYPTEELKCLDKVWHKGCFKCQVCNMTLNMKNYKGYDKLPYCNAHYPQTKHTAVADTPEQRRIAENTKIQSNIHYHSDFNREKGTYTQVADTLDMKLHLRNTQNLSQVQYKQEFEETKFQYTAVPDSKELERLKQNQRNISRVQYKHEFEETKFQYTAVPDSKELERLKQNQRNISRIKYHEEFEKQKGKKMTIADDPEMQRVKQNMEIISNVAYHGERDRKSQMEMMRPAEQLHVGPPRRQPGQIAEYTPEEHQTGGTPYSSRNSAGARQVYDSSVGKDENSPNGGPRRLSRGSVKTRGPLQIKGGQSVDDFIREDRVERFSSSGDDDSGMRYGGQRSPGYRGSMEQPPQRKVGSISDYDPMNEKYGSIAGQTGQGQKRSTGQPPQQVQQPAPQQFRPPEPQQGKGMVCKAMYDYQAADTDEVSFKEGDVIIYCQPIDAGWMEGTVERTGERGMLPSNYVETLS